MTLEKRSKTRLSPTKYRNDPALVEKVATRTTKVTELERLILLLLAAPPPPATGRPPRGFQHHLPTASGPPAILGPGRQQECPKANPVTSPTPAAPVKRDRTLIITRHGTAIPNDVKPLLLRNLLIAVANTTSDTLLKSRTKLEDTIRTAISSGTSLQKEVQVVQVFIHNILTTILSTSEGYLQVQTEVQSFNRRTTLHHAPGCVTRQSQREGEQASSMVLSIIGHPCATASLKGLILFGHPLKVTPYLGFDEATQCNSSSTMATHAPDTSPHLPASGKPPGCVPCFSNIKESGAPRIHWVQTGPPASH
ncbi:hypothetical protein Q9L58_010389 [Maublancomyces gigas]|uniref:Uncharacterized protein n=1 Tax=Discina gigas TaxID=1032678 RepID=A0ABR3G574_9PEZI